MAVCEIKGKNYVSARRNFSCQGDKITNFASQTSLSVFVFSQSNVIASQFTDNNESELGIGDKEKCF